MDVSDLSLAFSQAETTVSQPASPTSTLPPYARTLLKVELPVSVTLARKKEHLHEILEIVPGAIIQFDKSCEEILELEVNGQSVAVGEAVKVGDKFGLRITSMVLPEERFKPIAGSPES